MANFHKSDTSPQEQLVMLRGVVQRIDQAEHPEKFGLIRQLLLEQLRELETLTEQEASDTQTIVGFSRTSSSST
jgi:hypothetical protein